MTSTIKHLIIVSAQAHSIGSPQHREFSEALAQAQELSENIRSLRSLVDKHRVSHWAVIRPLLKRQADLKRAITIALDERLELGGVSAKQQRLIKRLICSSAKQFASQGDDLMRVLHDKHSEESLAEIEKAQTTQAQAYFEQMMGEAFEEDEPFENIDDVLHASIERMRKQAEAREQAKEKRKKRKGKTDINQDFELIADDGQTALRNIYRQLASALHPDREPDSALRLEKTKLMSEANTAYNRGDLIALIDLQSKANLNGDQLIGNLEASKIEALTVLIRERVRALERERRDFELETVAEFVLPSAVSIKPGTLKSHLAKLQRDLQSSISDLKSDMVEMSTATGLKRWLRNQEMYG